ncbi:MAG TPA: fructose-bisphosphatase class II, partial [Rhodospirillales bacterium]|nr:fructose-bisphosphatase class II [Rhodospirillales bacterium]
AETRAAGARIMLIADGDVSGVIATAWPQSGIDIYMGIGGAPQGVLAAAALACVGGQMQGRLVCRDESERKFARATGITDLEKKYDLADMAAGDVTFAATGVTNGAILRSVRREDGVTVTHSLVMRSRSGTLRYVESHHKFANPMEL